jgi:hypothetical protein
MSNYKIYIFMIGISELSNELLSRTGDFIERVLKNSDGAGL